MNEKPLSTFDWSIHEMDTWPPKGKPVPPFGPTALEMMRSCTLRLCFEYSKGYEHRTDYSARVGIAFHRTLQSLTEHPVGSSDPESVGHEATRRFREELVAQEKQKSTRPREQMLLPNEERVRRALEAVVVEAQRMAKYFAGQKQIVRFKQRREVVSPERNNKTDNIMTFIR